MPTLQFPEKTAPVSTDLGAKTSLLHRFLTQIAPFIHDQFDILCTALSPVVIQRALLDLYTAYLHHKTAEDQPANPQLDFIFHAFDPKTAPARPVDITGITTLIRTGAMDGKPTDGTPDLLPAPFWKLSEVEDRLADQLATQTLFSCASVTRHLEVKNLPEDQKLLPEEQIEHLLRRVVETLNTFLPEEQHAEATEPAPSTGPATAEADYSEGENTTN